MPLHEYGNQFDYQGQIDIPNKMLETWGVTNYGSGSLKVMKENFKSIELKFTIPSDGLVDGDGNPIEDNFVYLANVISSSNWDAITDFYFTYDEDTDEFTFVAKWNDFAERMKNASGDYGAFTCMFTMFPSGAEKNAAGYVATIKDVEWKINESFDVSEMVHFKSQW